MFSLRLLVICAALALGASGCTAIRTGAGAAPPVTWTRDARLDPWSSLPPSPTVGWIESALRQLLLNGIAPEEDCPFHLLRCEENAVVTNLRVDALTCTAVSEYTDRCSFRITETIPGEDGRPARRVRSRCTGTFAPGGTSHDPWQWTVSFHPDDTPLSCKRSR